ncbi:unnamed protein product [Lactuca saligna]|uniref:PI4-kinase N-terminal domain-containing protein n=1 Tax=Lactuca saligna TaxID=75948 RepID=A0AA35YUV6_LACSI|nr:unnamed protein product [Lactuca saligna]
MNPNLMPAVLQCLMAIVHRAFETALSWLEAQICETGDAAERFPQILWKSSCLDSLLFSVNGDPPSSLVNDPASVASVRSLYQSVVKEWIVDSLSYAPCTTQGLLQEQLCKANTWQKAQPTTDVVSLLSEIKIGTGKTDCWKGKKTANIPAVMASAAAASGGNLKSTEAFNIEPVHFGFVVSNFCIPLSSAWIVVTGPIWKLFQSPHAMHNEDAMEEYMFFEHLFFFTGMC